VNDIKKSPIWLQQGKVLFHFILILFPVQDISASHPHHCEIPVAVIKQIGNDNSKLEKGLEKYVCYFTTNENLTFSV